MYNRNSSYWPYKVWQGQASYQVASNVATNYVDFTRDGLGNLPANKVSSVGQGDYQPDPQLPSYNGPYPAHELQRARQSLIYSLTHDASDILQRIKPRLGISSCYGPACKFSAPKQLQDDTSSAAQSCQGINNQIQNNIGVSSKQVTSSQVSATVTSDAQSQNETSSQSKPSSTTTSDQITTKPKAPSSAPKVETQSDRSTSANTIADGAWTSPAVKKSLKRKSDVGDAEGTPAKKVHSDGRADVAGNNQIYKCDFCNTQDRSKDVITLHLNQAKHFSASLYITEGSRPVAVEQKLAVRQKIAKNEALAVMCPKCHDLFEDIFMCGMHYKYLHAGDSNEGYYSVTPIIHMENIMVNSDPRCQQCSTVYDKHRLLHKHWETQPSHHPVTKIKPKNALCIFSCLYCDKTFYHDFYGCKSHVVSHKDQNGQVRAVCAMKMRHILRPQRQEELLPMSESSLLNGLDDELKTLRNMKKHYQGMNGTKRKMKMIDGRMAFLQQFKRANANSSIS